MKPSFESAFHTGVGVALSISAAVFLALLGHRLPSRALLPWLFVLILISLSARYGPMVSLVGSIAGMLVFAHKVYAPVGSISVADTAAKTSLGWMALIAVCASYLLFPNHNRPAGH